MSDREFDLASVIVGGFVALAGVLFLLEPLVGQIPVFGVPTPAFVLSASVLTIGFGFGAVVYYRRGHRLFGLAHAVGAGGFGLVVGGTAVGSGSVLMLGVAVLVGGSAFLVSRSSRRT